MVPDKDKRAVKEISHLLGTCALFGGLNADERSAMAGRARIRVYEAGETVFTMGSPGNQLMALLSGSIRISVPSADGKELFLAVIPPGEMFGELAVFDGKERSADAVAETTCTVAALDRNDILSFFERNPSAWRKLVEVLCERLRRTDQVFAEVALLQMPARLAKTLLRAENWQGRAGAAKTPKIRFSQRELANMVGGTRERVNKCLSAWQRDGVIKVAEGSIAIVDRGALEKIAESSSRE